MLSVHPLSSGTQTISIVVLQPALKLRNPFSAFERGFRITVDCERRRRLHTNFALAFMFRQVGSTNELMMHVVAKRQLLKFKTEDVQVVRVKFKGLAGTGKSNLGRKILAYGRANGHLSFALASTALVATLYENGWTAHSFFKVEVRDDTDEDDTENRPPVRCLITRDRQARLEKTRLIFWDEFPSNDSEVFSAAYDALNKLKGKIIVAVGDFKQCPPVVQFGSRLEIVQASIKSHDYFAQFVKMELTRNMRLEGMQKQIELKVASGTATAADTLDLEAQIKYGKSLLAIGRGISTSDIRVLDTDVDTGRTLLRLNGFQYFTDEQSVIEFLYPMGLEYPNMIGKHVLVATNYLGDFWNSLIQEKNPNALVTLRSVDKLADCDDPYDILAGMLTKEVLAKYDHNGVPPHELNLKVGDIALVLITMSKADKITKNTRVLILKILIELSEYKH